MCAHLHLFFLNHVLDAHTSGGNVKCGNHFEKQFGTF